MKNICILLTDISTIGGVERVVELLAGALSRKHNIFLVCIQEKGDIKNRNLKNINYYSLSNSNRNVRYIFFSTIFNFKKYLKNNKIEIVISIDPTCHFYSIVATALTNIKLISCEHGNLKDAFANKGMRKGLRWMAARFADKIITLTPQDCNNYIDTYNLQKNKVDYIYNFIDDEVFHFSSKYNENSKKILTIARFDRVKGYELLVNVASEIFKKHPDWSWHLYGGGEQDYILEITELIKNLKLEKNLFIHGSTNAVYEKCAESSMFVLTSYFEGFSMVILEAKASNLPVISFDCPVGPRVLIENNISGCLIEPYNIEKMAEKINLLIEEKNLRILYSNNSRNNLAKFRKEKIIEKWNMTIENI